MTTTTKQILLVFGIIAFVFVGGIAAIFLFFQLTSTEASKADYAAKLAEGREFGKTTDQSGCMKEGLERASKIRRFETTRSVHNQAFVEECLKASHPSVGFCSGVPSGWDIRGRRWQEEQCGKADMNSMQTGCAAVFRAKLNYCQNQ